MLINQFQAQATSCRSWVLSRHVLYRTTQIPFRSQKKVTPWYLANYEKIIYAMIQLTAGIMLGVRLGAVEAHTMHQALVYSLMRMNTT
ncbi:MAG: hypothetical protein DRG87_11340 [Deltaproteobacteria bacterium]|nr:MAG: hypothetical protein DRG87_11340 [Deltaproteobacteria bacterium]